TRGIVVYANYIKMNFVLRQPESWDGRMGSRRDPNQRARPCRASGGVARLGSGTLQAGELRFAPATGPLERAHPFDGEVRAYTDDERNESTAADAFGRRL